MGGITVDDFTSSVAYREIFGLGRQEGRQESRQEGRQAEAAALHPAPAATPLRHPQLGSTVPHPGPAPRRSRSLGRCPARLPGARGPQRLAEPPRQLSPSRFSRRTVPEICAMGGIPLPIAQATCRGPAFTLRRVPMAPNDSGQPTLLRSTTAREQARAAGCLQRISLPGRRVQRRHERGEVNGLSEVWRTRHCCGAPPA